MDELNFTFAMPDDETLAKYIPIKGEKGERGDPTKTSQLTNDSDFTTNAALSAGLATKANASTVQAISTQVNANTAALASISSTTINASANGASEKWYLLGTLPIPGASGSNDATLMIHGKIGSTGSSDSALIDIMLRTRGQRFEALGDFYAARAGDIDCGDIVAYTVADGSTEVYLHFQQNWAVMQLTVDTRAQATNDYTGTALTIEPEGTLIWELSTDEGIQKNIGGTILADIDGDAATVNGHTVDADVPSDAVFTDTVYDDSAIQSEIDLKANIADVAAAYATKAEVQSVASGSPIPVSSTSDMTDTTRTYLLTTTGHWYYYDGSTWADGGVYQSTGLADNSVTYNTIYGHDYPFDAASIIDYRELAEGYVNGSTGQVVSGVSGTGLKYVTPYIEVDPSVTFKRGDCQMTMACYDLNKSYLGRISMQHDDATTATPYANTKYVRFSIGYVIGSTGSYDVTKAVVYPVEQYESSFFSIDQLYEKSSSRVVYRTSNQNGYGVGGGIYHDPIDKKIIIQNCTYCAILSNRAAFPLANSTLPTSFTLADYSSTSADEVGIWYDLENKEMVYTEGMNSALLLDNNHVFVASVNGYNCHVAGIGELSQLVGIYPYFRPSNSSDTISVTTADTTITIGFPAGSWYLVKDTLAYDRKAGNFPTHAAASYTLAHNDALVLNIDDWTLSVETFARNTFVASPHNITLLVNVDGKFVAGKLLPQLDREIVKTLEETTLSKNVDADGMFDFYMSATMPYWISDYTFVGDELWGFTASNDAHSNTEYIRRFSLDFENKTLTYLGSISHNFGHCNTVDYCAENDTLILGNGGTVSNTEPDQIYIVENVSTIKELSSWTLSGVAKVIDLDDAGLDWGRQINVCWGSGNRGNYNTAYVLSNDGSNKIVHEIILGRGTNQLTYGTLVAADEDEFNGTMNILNSYCAPGYSATICNQGSQFHNGELWESIGHAGAWIHKSKLLTNGSITWDSLQELTRDDSGNVVSSYAEGCCIKGDYLVTSSNISGTGSTLLVYKV